MTRSLVPVLFLLSASSAFGAWSNHTLQDDAGMQREYWVYTPSNGSGTAGIMMFFHGNYMTDDFPDGGDVRGWQVAQNAEHHGFIGVVPKGSRCTDTEKPLFHWNVDATHATPNEVQLAHHIMRNVTAAHSVPADAPKLVLGFSNGAAMADLLTCNDGSHLFTAHAAGFYQENADFPSTCEQVVNPCAKWNGVGEQDPFIWTLGVPGLLAQFSALHAQYNCSNAPEINTTVAQPSAAFCHEYPQCEALGQLCTYPDTQHEIKPGMTSAAWSYLTQVTGSAHCTGLY